MAEEQIRQPSSARQRILLLLRWYSPAIHRGIARFASQVDWILDAQPARYGILPAQWDGDGIICIISENEAYAGFVRQANVPAVNLAWRDCPLHIPMVLHDDATIGLLGARHFLSKGFEDLAFYKAETLLVAKDRLDTFAGEVRSAGKRFHCLDWAEHNAQALDDTGSRHQWLAERLKSLPKPIAIMAQNDDFAVELLNACHAAGLFVPQQVAILGCDNEELDCNFAAVPISSVDTDLEGLGYNGAKLLWEILQHTDTPAQPVLIPPKGIVERKSSDILAVADPHVARALSFISENFHDPIGVQDVVKAVGLSRRSLYNAFANHLGHSIGQEITRRRIQHACRLLQTTSYKIHEISRLAGFTTPELMARVFQRELHTNPAGFRKSHQKSPSTKSSVPALEE